MLLKKVVYLTVKLFMTTEDFFYDDSCINEHCCCRCMHMFIMKHQITLERCGYICAAPVHFNVQYNEHNTDVYKMTHPHGECEMFERRRHKPAQQKYKTAHDEHI